MRALSWLLDVLFPPRDTDLLVRTITDDTLASRMAPMSLDDGTVTALFPYRDTLVHALIIETKYFGSTDAASLLGTHLAEYLLEYLADINTLEKRRIVLIPLPLSQKRRRSRGYNQIENILKVTASLLGREAVVDSSVLTRRIDTTPQTHLRKTERKENVAGAFAAQTPDPQYLYIVVDDVYTTGATLTEALTTLKNAGALHVRGLTLAC
ncbi:hypothetical protein K2Y00_02035 [Patescibacteria group bacterium]|nr:hypothetical protein [Patescibacteria group bacterium]